MFGTSNPPKSVDSLVADPDGIAEIDVVAKFLLTPNVPFNLILEPGGGGYVLVIPRPLEILPIVTSVPVAGINPIVI